MSITCELPYIKTAVEAEASSLSPEEQESLYRELIEKHIDTARAINNSQLFSKASKDGNIYFFMSKELGKRGEQIDFLNGINSSAKLAYPAVVRLSPNYDSEIVVVDARSLIKQELGEFSPTQDYVLEDDVIVSLNKSFFESEHLKNPTQVEEFTEENAERVREITTEVLDKLAAFNENFIKNERNLNPRFQKKYKDLTRLYSMLADTEETVDSTASVSKIIVEAKRTLSYVNNKTNLLPEAIASLNTEDSRYFRNAAQIGETIQEATELYSIFSTLKDLANAVKKEEYRTLTYGYNTQLLEQNILKLFPEHQEQVKELLEENKDYDSIASFTADLSSVIGEDFLVLFPKVQEAFEISKAKSYDVFQNLIESGELASAIGGNLRDLHYNLLTEVLYNEQLSAYGVVEETDLTALKDLNFVSKEELKAQLKLAENDISSTQYWVGGSREYKDVISQAITSLVVSRSRVAKLKTDKDAIQAVNDLKTFGLSIDSEKRKEWESKFIEEITYLDATDRIELATEDGEPSLEILDIEGNKKKIKARKGLGYVTKQNYANVVASQKEFFSSVDSKTDELFNSFYSVLDRTEIEHIRTAEYEYDLYFINPDDVASIEALNTSPYTKKVFDTFFTYRRFIIDQNSSVQRLVFKSPNIERDKIKASLIAGFFSHHYRDKTTTELINTFSDAFNYSGGSLSETVLRGLNEKDSSAKRRFFYNTTEKPFSIDDNILNKPYLFNSIAGIPISETEKEFIVKKTDGTFTTIRATLGKDIVTLNVNEEYLENIDNVYFFSGEYRNLNEAVHPVSKGYLDLERLFKQEPNAENYYKFLMNRYKESNGRLYDHRLRFNLLPQIQKANKSSLIEYFKSPSSAPDALGKWFKSFEYQERNVAPIYGKDEAGERVYTDEFGRAVSSPVYRKKQYSNNEDIRTLTPKFIDQISSDELETDLFVSSYVFNISTTQYEELKNLDPLVNIIKNVLNGNDLLQMQQRTSKKKFKKNNLRSIASLPFGRAVGEKAEKAYKDTGLKSSKAIVAFLNDYIYGESTNDWSIAGLSASKIGNSVSSLINFQVLALNFTAMFTNVTVGSANNLILAVGERHGLSAKVMKKAFGTYWKNALKFTEDATKKYAYETSLYSQLAYYFDAIKGELADGREQFMQKSIAERLLSPEALYYTTKLAEHHNQIILMIAFLNSFTVGSQKLIDFIKHQPGEAFSFDIEALEKEGISEKQFETLLNDFTKKLDDLNTEAHGQYGYFERSMLERKPILNLTWKFSKWLYSGYKARMRDAAYDWQSKSWKEEGYMKQYFKFLIKDLKQLIESEELSQAEGFRNKVRVAYEAGGLKTLGKATIDFLVKQGLLVLDRAAQGKLAASPRLKEYLYGNETEENFENRRRAIVRASFELSLWTGSLLFSMIVRGLMDDDEDDSFKNKLLQSLDLQAKRFHSDLGIYLFTAVPFGNFQPFDYASRKISDPFSMRRTLDVNVGLLSQLVGFDITEDGDINFKIDDRYVKNGRGYERGDLKIMNKLEKSVFSPYYQVMRLLNPEQDIAFQAMLNKSSASVKKDKAKEEEELEAEASTK